VIEQRNLHEKFGERACLNVVVVGFTDPANPGIRRAILRNVKLKALSWKKKRNESGGL
jgi:hypothetical protein